LREISFMCAKIQGQKRMKSCVIMIIFNKNLILDTYIKYKQTYFLILQLYNILMVNRTQDWETLEIYIYYEKSW
jgi:hypothetical protein